ncbi:MAG: AAA family ATPase [Campylobacter sp.]|uniref:AAA family ATPase n=1 Tax=Campylobacter sp. TaxID=205 RepID=UPI001B11BA6C|nr:AAA family ATPase [Campylobacter sp.]MBO7154441.1 AAA family ATPase [Campylobacter sp.]
MDNIKDTKQLYIFAGVNGSGKSTFYINQLLKNDFYGYRVNSDELAKELGNYESSYIQNKAGKLAIAMRNKFLNSGASFNMKIQINTKLTY